MTEAIIGADQRVCPKCSRVVKRRSRVCNGCAHILPVSEFLALNPVSEKDKKLSRVLRKGLLWTFGGMMVLGLAMNLLGLNKGGLQDRQAGFHCLNAWDGSQFSVVDYAKARMRDPGSFEHIETRIKPQDSQGNHLVWMSYRGRNGFGGTAVDTIIVKIRNNDCSAVGVG